MKSLTYAAVADNAQKSYDEMKDYREFADQQEQINLMGQTGALDQLALTNQEEQAKDIDGQLVEYKGPL